MTFINKVIIKGMALINKIQSDKETDHKQKQYKTLSKLIKKAQFTEFGETYNFEVIKHYSKPKNFDLIYNIFKKSVPIFDYNLMYDNWWHRTKNGEKDICWPGKTKYFALSSGTTGSSSKFIPVSKTMIKNIQSVSIRQLRDIVKLESSNSELFQKSYLLVGGSSTLTFEKGKYFGDLSGILQKKVPKWFNSNYKPGLEINSEKNWDKKIEKIAENAHLWDIGIIAGIPSWIVLLFEKICEKHGLKHIHEIWPNLSIYVWGGVSIQPYRSILDNFFDPTKEVRFLETYLASEGFLGYEKNYNSGLKLVVDKGIFYEFVPFDDNNFTSEGNLKNVVTTLLIHQLEDGVTYAPLISTCSGAWRYLLGDTICFTNIKNLEFKITGRTKQALNLCGEHVSVDNLNQVINEISKKYNFNIPEFSVAGQVKDGKTSHIWYIGSDYIGSVDELKESIDSHLKELNDDYKVERDFALESVTVEIVPVAVFYKYMRENNKIGGQNKFPRVLTGSKMNEWISFLESIEIPVRI